MKFLIYWYMPLPSCSGSSEFSLKIVHDLFFFCCAYLFSSLSRVPLFLATKVRIVCTFSEFFFFINRLLFAERNLHILPLHVPGSALVSTALPSARATCPGGSSQGPAALLLGYEHWVGVPWQNERLFLKISSLGLLECCLVLVVYLNVHMNAAKVLFIPLCMVLIDVWSQNVVTRIC